MPFGRDTCVVSSNIVLDMGPREGEICGSEPLVRSYAVYRQITLARVSVI